MRCLARVTQKRCTANPLWQAWWFCIASRASKDGYHLVGVQAAPHHQSGATRLVPWGLGSPATGDDHPLDLGCEIDMKDRWYQKTKDPLKFIRFGTGFIQRIRDSFNLPCFLLCGSLWYGIQLNSPSRPF